LQTLPDSICNIKSLTFLNLKSNRINSLPESIGKLKSLKKLELYGNRLKTLPKAIGDLTSLEILNIRFNYIKEIPQEIGRLGNLKKLVLANNHWQLSTIPESIGNLSSLEYLDLRMNKLIRLPSSITRLSSLKYLDLHTCYLEEIPERFGDFKSLEHLDLGRNELKTLPESMLELKSLKELILEENEFICPACETNNFETEDLKYWYCTECGYIMTTQSSIDQIRKYREVQISLKRSKSDRSGLKEDILDLFKKYMIKNRIDWNVDYLSAISIGASRFLRSFSKNMLESLIDKNDYEEFKKQKLKFRIITLWDLYKKGYNGVLEVFKEEIFDIFKSGILFDIFLLIEHKYLSPFNELEIKRLFNEFDFECLRVPNIQRRLSLLKQIGEIKYLNKDEMLKNEIIHIFLNGSIDDIILILGLKYLEEFSMVEINQLLNQFKIEKYHNIDLDSFFFIIKGFSEIMYSDVSRILENEIKYRFNKAEINDLSYLINKKHPILKNPDYANLIEKYKSNLSQKILEFINLEPILLLVVVTGERNTGRLAFINRYIKNRFVTIHFKTGVQDLQSKDIIFKGKKYRLTLWCERGPERFHSQKELFYDRSQGIFFLFDLTHPFPSERLEKEIIFIRKINADIPILLVGTKLDLNDNIVVMDDAVLNFREEYNLVDYIKISAKTGEHIKEAYNILIKEILKGKGK